VRIGLRIELGGNGHKPPGQKSPRAKDPPDKRPPDKSPPGQKSPRPKVPPGKRPPGKVPPGKRPPGQKHPRLRPFLLIFKLTNLHVRLPSYPLAFARHSPFQQSMQVVQHFYVSYTQFQQYNVPTGYILSCLLSYLLIWLFTYLIFNSFAADSFGSRSLRPQDISVSRHFGTTKLVPKFKPNHR